MKILKKPQVYLPFVILVLTFIVYQPVLKNQFVNIDDETLIIDNPLVNQGKDVSFGEMWKKNKGNPHFKPMVYLSWNLEYRKWQDNPVPYHVNNLILHLLNTLLMFVIGLRLYPMLIREKKKIGNVKYIFAAIIASFFALHPLHVESVAWATERKDVLYSLFFLSAFLSYLFFLEKRNYLFLILSLAMYFLTVITKSMGLTLILFVLMIDIYYNKGFKLKTILSIAGFVGLFIFGMHLYGLLTSFSKNISGITAGIVTQSGVAYPENIDSLPSFLRRILVINARYFLWFFHVIVPAKSSIIYPRMEILERLGGFIYLLPVFNLGLFIFLVIKRKKLGPMLFGFLFFSFALLPAIAISDTGISVFLSDRYVYMAATGIFIMLFFISDKVAEKYKKRSLPYIVFGALLLVFSIYTNKLVKQWETSETLWTHVLSNYDNIPVAYSNRGKYYRENDLPEKAIKDYNKAIQLQEGYFLPYYNRAKIHYDAQRYDEAFQDYNKVLELNPEYFRAHTMRGVINFVKGDTVAARIDFEKAYAKDSTDLELLRNYGLYYFNLQKYQASIDIYEQYLAIDESGDIINSIGVSYLRTKSFDKAKSYFNKAIQLEPTNGTYILNRSYANFFLKDTLLAYQDAAKSKGLGVAVSESYLKMIGPK